MLPVSLANSVNFSCSSYRKGAGGESSRGHGGRGWGLVPAEGAQEAVQGRHSTHAQSPIRRVESCFSEGAQRPRLLQPTAGLSPLSQRRTAPRPLLPHEGWLRGQPSPTGGDLEAHQQCPLVQSWAVSGAQKNAAWPPKGPCSQAPPDLARCLPKPWWGCAEKPTPRDVLPGAPGVRMGLLAVEPMGGEALQALGQPE